MLVIFGTNKSEIGRVNFTDTKCSNCSKKGKFVQVLGSYFSLFFIPIFSLGKRMVVKCPFCNQDSDFQTLSHTEKEAFHKKFKEQKIKIPKWHNLGIMLFFVLIILIVIGIVYSWVYSTFIYQEPNLTEYENITIEEIQYDENDSIKTFIKSAP